MAASGSQRPGHEAWLRTLAERAPAVFFLFDRDGIVREVLGQGVRDLSLLPEETVGRSVFALFARIPWLRQSVERTLAGDAFVVTGELQKRWFDIQFVPVRGPDGAVEAVSGLATDVTERVEATEATRSAHQDYEALVDSIDGIVWEADARTFCFTFVSRQAERLLGFPQSAWYEPGFWATQLLAADRDGAVQYCKESTAAGLPHDFEYRMLSADGRVVWLRDIVTVVEAADGRRLLRGVMVDITVQKQLEEERLRLVERAELALARAERAERRWAFLAEASRALASSRDETVLLDTVTKLAVDQDVATWCAVFRLQNGHHELQAFAHADPTRGEVMRRRLEAQPPPPGSETAAGDRVLTVPIAQGGRVTCSLALSVESPAPPFDEDDARLAEELGRRCALALENARLFRAERDAVRVREDFLSIASHELRTPLTPLFLRLRALEKRLAGTPMSIELRKIRGAADRLRNLVDDLLDVTRIDEGRLPFRQEPVSLRDLTRELVTSLATLDAQHTVSLSEPDADVTVFGDRGRLEQVISNVLDNAIKYSPTGGEVQVTLSVADGNALVSVRDEGIGIPADQHAELFERFFRARNASATSFGGLGLGLYISRDIVLRHGGRIWLESEVGRGSTFFVSLPVHDPARRAPADATSLESAAPEEALHG